MVWGEAEQVTQWRAPSSEGPTLRAHARPSLGPVAPGSQLGSAPPVWGVERMDGRVLVSCQPCTWALWSVRGQARAKKWEQGKASGRGSGEGPHSA